MVDQLRFSSALPASVIDGQVKAQSCQNVSSQHGDAHTCLPLTPGEVTWPCSPCTHICLRCAVATPAAAARACCSDPLLIYSGMCSSALGPVLAPESQPPYSSGLLPLGPPPGTATSSLLQPR